MDARWIYHAYNGVNGSMPLNRLKIDAAPAGFCFQSCCAPKHAMNAEPETIDLKCKNNQKRHEIYNVCFSTFPSLFIHEL